MKKKPYNDTTKKNDALWFVSLITCGEILDGIHLVFKVNAMANFFQENTKLLQCIDCVSKRNRKMFQDIVCVVQNY